jgi:hypothetical protein
MILKRYSSLLVKLILGFIDQGCSPRQKLRSWGEELLHPQFEKCFPPFHNLGKIFKKLISLHGSKHCSDNKRYKKKRYITKPIDLFLCLSVLKIWYQSCKPMPGPFLKLTATPHRPVHTHLHYCTIQYICSFNKANKHLFSSLIIIKY